MASKELAAAEHALQQAIQAHDLAGIKAARDLILACLADAVPDADAQASAVTQADIDQQIAAAGLFVFPDGDIRELTEAHLAAAGQSVGVGDGRNTAAAKLRAALVRMGFDRRGLEAHADRIAAAATRAAESADAAEADAPAQPRTVDHALVAQIMAAHPALTGRNELLRAVRQDLEGMGLGPDLVGSHMDAIKDWVRDELQHRRDAASALNWAQVNAIVSRNPDVLDLQEMQEIVTTALAEQGIEETAIAAKRSEIEGWLRHRLEERQAATPKGAADVDAGPQPAETPAPQASDEVQEERAPPSPAAPREVEAAPAVTEAAPEPAPAPEQAAPDPKPEPAPEAPPEAAANPNSGPARTAQQDTPPPAGPSAEELRKRRYQISSTMSEVLVAHPNAGFEDLKAKLTEKLFFKGWNQETIEGARAEIAEIASERFQQQRQERVRQAQAAARGRSGGAPPRKPASAGQGGGGGGVAALVLVLLLAAAGGGYWYWSGQDTATPQSGAVAATSAPAEPPVEPTLSAVEERRRNALDFPLRKNVFAAMSMSDDSLTEGAVPGRCGYEKSQDGIQVVGFKFDPYEPDGFGIRKGFGVEIRIDDQAGLGTFLRSDAHFNTGRVIYVGGLYEQQLRALTQGAPVDAQGRIGVLETDFQDADGKHVRARSGLVIDSNGELALQVIEPEDVEKIFDRLDTSRELSLFSTLRTGPDWQPRPLTPGDSSAGVSRTSILSWDFTSSFLNGARRRASDNFSAGKCRTTDPKLFDMIDLISRNMP